MYGSVTSGRRRRSSGSGLLIAAVASLALLVSACGGDEKPQTAPVANLQTDAGAPAAPSVAPPSKDEVKKMALAYSKCMRENGVPKFPDPAANGGIAIDSQEVDQNSPEFRKAHTACESKLPAPPAGVGAPEDRAAALKYSQCMRENGVTKFPDPNADGGLDLDVEKIGMDPRSPVFKKAEDACKKYQGGDVTTQGQ